MTILLATWYLVKMWLCVCDHDQLHSIKSLNKLIWKANGVVGIEWDSLTAVDSVSHPLHDILVRHRSTFSERLIPPKCMTERHRKSFLPVVIKLYSSSLWMSLEHSTPSYYSSLYGLYCSQAVCTIYFLLHLYLFYFNIFTPLICFVYFYVSIYLCIFTSLLRRSHKTNQYPPGDK